MSLIYHSMLLRSPTIVGSGHTINSDYSVVLNGTSYIHPATKITIGDSGTWSVMLKSDFSTDQMIIDQRTSDIHGIQPLYISSSKQIQFYTYKGGSVEFDASSSLKPGEWNHVALVLSHSTVSCYVNGELLGRIKYYTDSKFSYLPVYIGRRYVAYNLDTYYYYIGTVSDVRIYDHAMSHEDIKQICNRLVLHYSFDDYTDEIRDGSDFMLHPVVTNCTVASEGNLGENCASFVASEGNYITLPVQSKLPGSMSYNIWVYMDDWSCFVEEDMRILSCTQTGGHNIKSSPTSTANSVFRFVVYDGGINEYRNIDTTVLCSSLTTGWHMFTFTFDRESKGATAYIDGRSCGSTILDVNYLKYDITNTLFLGAEASGDRITPESSTGLFTGKISDFRLYAKPLSVNEITNLYEARAKIYQNSTALSTHRLTETDVNSPYVTDSGNFNVKNFVENHYIHTDDGATFLQIFGHDVSLNTECFTTADVKDSIGPNRFSNLYYLNDDRFKNSDGKYEFLLRYPRAVQLPDGYKRVTYIESNGEKVDVGYSGKNFVYWHDIEFNSSSSRQLMGFTGSTGTYWGKTETNYFEIEQQGTWDAATNRSIVKFKCGDLTQDEDSPLRRSSLTINGGNAYTSATGETSGNYYLFGLNSDNPQFNCYCKLYRFTIYYSDPDTTAPNRRADFFPCIRISDGAAGICDVVNNKFIKVGIAGGIEEDASLYNRWKQSHNPLTTSTPSNYESTALNIQMPNYWHNTGIGLNLDTSSFALLESRLEDDELGYWHGSIGHYQLYQGTGFPSPMGTVLSSEELYVRIDNTSFKDSALMRKDVVYMDEFIEE